MQKKPSLDRFYPQTFALWATIAALGAMSPAHADTSPISTETNSTSPTADQIDLTAIAKAIEESNKPQNQTLQLAAAKAAIVPESMAIAPVGTEAQPTATADKIEVVAIAPETVTPEVEEVSSVSASTNSELASISDLPEVVETAVTAASENEATQPAILATQTADIAATPVEARTELSPENLLLTQDEPNEPRVLVAEIQINGTEGNAELEQAIVRAIETQAGRPTTVSQIRNDVNRVYATGLFSNVVATPEDTALGVRVTFDVVANPVLTKVVLQPLPLDGSVGITETDVVENIFSDRYGQIINLNDFQEGSGKLQQLQTWYQDNGYDLAKVIGIDEPTADGVVTLVVVEGVIESIKVNFINAENEPVDGRTREFIVTREMELKPGDVFRRDVAQRDLQRVFGLGIFEDVKLDFTSGTEDPTKAVLNLNVIEGNTGSIAAGGGISSASGLFGSVSYQQQNLGGNNQRLATELQVGTRDILFDVSFTDPWIAGDPYRTSYTVNGFRRRSISLIFDGGGNEINLQNGDRPRINRTGGGISFSRPLSKEIFAPADWRASVGVNYERVRLTDSDGNTDFVDAAGNQLTFSDDGKDDLLSMNFNLVRDKRFTVDGAARGSVARIGTDQTIPFGASSILFNRLRGSYSFYMDSPLKFPTFGEEKKPHTLAFNIQGGTIIGDLPPYEAFSLGGSNSVRGYEEGEVGSGRRYVQATAEYRFPVFAMVGGALFADYATDLGSGDNVPGNPAGIRGKPGNGFGYGVGVRVQSPLGQIRVDYGITDDGDNRIHFGIGERF